MYQESEYISSGKAAKMLGVAVVTLRRWEKLGKLSSIFRTFGRHRRYKISDIKNIIFKNNKKVVCYSRVSSHDQKKDLEIQSQKLVQYCKKNKLRNIQEIKDIGSGLNYKKRGLNQLISMILNQEISHIVLNHKERLLRFGSEILFKLCQFCNVKIVIIESEVKNFNQELCESVIEIMTVFCSKLYGSRSDKNKKALKVV